MKKHYIELDSLRGLAALTVLIWHFLLIYAFIEPNTFGQQGFEIINNFKYSPLRIFFAGHEAVILFFLLSGFVLSLPYYKDNFKLSSVWYKGYLIKRFFRIYVPYIISTIIAITVVLLLSHSFINGASDFVNRIWAKEITFSMLLNHFILIGEFDTKNINPVIWSLVHEMRISIIFPFIMLLILKLSYRKSLLIALFFSLSSYILINVFTQNGTASILITPHYISMFMVGALLAKNIERIVKFANKINPIAKLLLFAIAVCAYTYTWLFHDIRILHVGYINEWAVVLGASIFIILAFSSRTMSAFLNMKPIHYLGKISYSLYLYHIISLLFVVHFWDNYDDKLSILFFSFLLSFSMAMLSYHFIELPAIRMGRKLSVTKEEVKSLSSKAI